MAELRGIDYLRKKLESKRSRVNIRYQYYELKNAVKDFRISTPPELDYFRSVLGWCAKSVDSLADRIVFNEFRNDFFGLNEVYAQNNPDILFDSSTLSALISACSFIYISPDANGKARMQVIDGGNATGVIDPITNMLTEGYAVLERDDYGHPVEEAYLLPHETIHLRLGREYMRVTHASPYALLVPIIYRPDARRPFGHARISRAQMSLVESACRSIKRSEISSEFYSFPQKWVTGLSEDVEILDNWKATMSSLIALTNDEDGNHPILGQFQQQTMSPHVEQIKMFASLFAGETGLTVDDLGFTTSNPASAESIKASHDNLRLTARKAQRCFGSGFLNAGYLARCLEDGKEYNRSELVNVRPVFEPIFEPDVSTLSAIGDAILKISQASPDYITPEVLDDLTGIKR